MLYYNNKKREKSTATWAILPTMTTMRAVEITETLETKIYSIQKPKEDNNFRYISGHNGIYV